jgi:type II secretion system protein J
MKMSGRTTERKAFTLLEIVIALSMLVLILASAYGSYAATMRSLRRCRTRHVLQQQAGIFLERLASEIRCCYAGYQEEPAQSAIKPAQRAKKEELNQKQHSLFSGKEASSGRSFLRFVTSAIASKREHKFGGLAVVEYMLDSSENTLLRSKRRYLDGFEVDKDDYNRLVILENVQDVTIEFLDDEEWLKKWDSNDKGGLLPQAIRISVVMQPEDGGPLSFESIVQVVCRERHSGAVTIQKTNESDHILQSIRDKQKAND